VAYQRCSQDQTTGFFLELGKKMALEPFLELVDYRRRVAQMYAEVRNAQGAPEVAWKRFRQAREKLFRTHPQSALDQDQKKRFDGLPYYPYNPDLRLPVQVDSNVLPDILEVQLQEDGITRLKRFGKVNFEMEGQRLKLSLFWVLGYGGGVFLPFRDATAPEETYGGGRYLLDTIKGADLGLDGGRLMLDFNYAYSPSCAYNPRWHCPLAPRENWLPVALHAGELNYPWGDT
jgi:uncharacterized protein (DUF1684 family)